MDTVKVDYAGFDPSTDYKVIARISRLIIPTDDYITVEKSPTEILTIPASAITDQKIGVADPLGGGK